MRAIELTLHEIKFKITKSESKGGENSGSFFSSSNQLFGAPKRISTANHSASARKEGQLSYPSYSFER
jgi:hypothetical protein